MGLCAVLIMHDSFVSVDIKASHLKRCKRDVSATLSQCFLEGECLIKLKKSLLKVCVCVKNKRRQESPLISTINFYCME